MENKDKLKIGGIAFVIMLVGSMAGFNIDQMLNSDEPIYKCIDEEKIRNCPNGVKTSGKRCYYNETNPYSYDYCSDGWQEIDKDKILEELYGSDEQEQDNTVNPNKGIGQKIKCSENGCVKI